MPSYGELHSPSLNKMNGMNGNMDSHHMADSRGRHPGRREGRMSMENIIGDPFALATISIAILAWIITLVGQILAEVQGNKSIPKFSWLGPVWMLACIIGVFVVVASNTVQTYHVAIVGYLAIGAVVVISAANNLIYEGAAPWDAAAAGNIILAMICIVWIFYFGSQPSAVSRAYLDSFALNKEPVPRHSRGMSHGYSGRPDTSISSHHQAPQMYTSAQLNGFETSSPVHSGFNHNGSMNDRTSSAPRFGTANGTMPNNSSNLNSSSNPNMSDGVPINEVTAPTEYPYRAKAIYSYDANPEDANEISFSKGEILDVSDVSGRWWQAKKANGATGIAPSNYLILL